MPAILRRPAVPGMPQAFLHSCCSFGLGQCQPAIRSAGPVRVLFVEKSCEDGIVWREWLRGWFRWLQFGDGPDQGQEIGQIRLRLLEPLDLLLSLIENRLNQGRLLLIEGRQEVMREMPRCEVGHKG